MPLLSVLLAPLLLACTASPEPRCGPFRYAAEVVAHDPATGAVAWRRSVAAFLPAGAVVAGDVVAVSGGQAGQDRTVRAYATDDGIPRWRSRGAADDLVLAADQRTVYIASGRLGMVEARDARSGRKLWQISIDTDGAVSPLALSVAGDRLVVLGEGRRVHVLDASTGKRLGRFDVTDLLSRTAAAEATRADADRWRLLQGATLGDMIASTEPAVLGLQQLGGGELVLLAVEDGTVRWRRTLRLRAGEVNLQVLGGDVLLLHVAGTLRRLATATGLDAWTASQPIVDRDGAGAALAGPGRLLAPSSRLGTAGTEGRTTLDLLDAANGRRIARTALSGIAGVPGQPGVVVVRSDVAEGAARLVRPGSYSVATAADPVGPPRLAADGTLLVLGSQQPIFCD